MLFMQDAIVARELAYSISEGDIGRAYECIKIMLFTFAGSTHTKYATYLLKMICNLELECSPELKDAILSNWLVNLEGLPKHNDVEWDGPLMCSTISRNVAEFSRIKKDLLEGLGLAQKSGKHPKPHDQPEIKTLLRTYQEEELYLFHSGRKYSGLDISDFARGINKLCMGKLEKWIRETTTAHGMFESHQASHLQRKSHSEEEVPEDSDTSNYDGSKEERGKDEHNNNNNKTENMNMYFNSPNTPGLRLFKDGELMVEFDAVDNNSSDDSWASEAADEGSDRGED
ncbi:hypothetical protein SERLADRAFT_443584 [Serpula lacrymans var. lacrymans S7.9]|uniref:DUF6589 domain-containing protein n=1 Tax=Serpula lacrymans var. lacrymans (strain S7.9) TaxID=578457 RepID=F8PCU6_SERL9|nr:uncharacterized protein SERLADRAFT_443584 [Serpula lacrymans var. lacrymans S7.9]EGO19045.1 hypothetical protein SERLADRAFT_443584 [Serpula lacrymans var. lacrymans S7.9]